MAQETSGPLFGAPIKAEAVAVPPAPAAGPTNATGSTWTVRLSDRFIRRVVERWSKQAGYQAVYEVDRDVAVAAEATFGGDYATAMGGLMAGLERSELPLRVCLYTNQVTRVVRRSDRCE
jgi:hypothetical protein